MAYVERVLKASAQTSAMRARILDAAFSALWLDGFARTSARSIAARGGFNQSLIFYHFGSVNSALLAALDRISAQRMSRYRETLEAPMDLGELIGAARRLYGEDIQSGHSTVLAELFSASVSDPELRDQMLQRIQPWLEFTEDLVRRQASEIGLLSVVDGRAAASALLALYVGTDLLTHLEQDRSRATFMFEAGERVAAILSPLLGVAE